MQMLPPDTWAPALVERCADRYVSSQALFEFLVDLLQARGELARLLLVIAEANRPDREPFQAWATEHFWAAADSEPSDPAETVGALPERPPSWWEQADRRAVVVEQLRRCLHVLTANAETA
jgi:hypothetical protein